MTGTLVDADTVMAAPVHPVADLFPLLPADELATLTEDIRKNGLREPVWLWDDPERGLVLLDGRNRRAACERLGVVPASYRFVGSPEAAIDFVVSQNIHRRHLTPGQKAALAVDVLPFYEAEAKKAKAHGATAPGKPKEQTLGADLRQASDAGGKPERAPKAAAKAAAKAGASERAVQQFKRVQKAAPDLAEKVRAGDIALDRAERIIRDREAEARKVAEAQAAAEAAGVSTTVDIRHGDFRDVLADIHDVDAIITDPPYPAEYLPLLGDLAAFADKVLKPEGVLVVLIGQTHLPEVYRLLDGHRPYRWTGCYLTAGAGYVSHPRRVQSNWKPLLVYGGGPRFSDVVRADGDAAAKQLHKWGQDFDAFHTIVERFTKRGDTVVDPFMGAGTTLLAAHALGRNAVGCDIDEASVATARERLS